MSYLVDHTYQDPNDQEIDPYFVVVSCLFCYCNEHFVLTLFLCYLT